ncbi:zinc dependent phospholipase C family protein [Paenibacillus sp. FSL H7-0756]|uniref:zinc dependent phospholipase C family protein n=1 Tax=Paenibacillus sp. FSL H7-0756 TaxID=2954738 RepID=UPI0030F8935B
MQLAEKLKINSEVLHLGGLAPDAVGSNDQSKDKSHFRTPKENGKKRINLGLFLEKYGDRMQDPFYLGYFSHLVADYFWYDCIMVKYFKPLSTEDRRKAGEIGYLDFWILNAKLIHHFKLTKCKLAIEHNEMDLIDMHALSGVIDQFEADFIADPIAEHSPLGLYTFEDILSYIDRSVKETVSRLSEVQFENKDCQER